MGLLDTSTSAQVRFITLTDYCVVEYTVEPLGSTIFTTDNYYRIVNAFNNSKQVFNTDAAQNDTGNIRDLTVVEYDNNRTAYLDSEQNPNYDNYDPNLTTTLLQEYTVVQDTIKFHFQAGFNFQDFPALILAIKAQMNDGNFFVMCELLLSALTWDSVIRLNPKPLFLNGIVYDKFVVVKIPSVKNINNDYYTSPTPSTTFAYAATNGIGLVPNIPLTINLFESLNHFTIFATNGNQYDGYELSSNFETKLAQTNDIDNLGATIMEATDGDYIEFFMEWNDGFPDELIVNLNKQTANANWNIIHQLTVFEQVGSDFIASPPFTLYQTANFDAPLKFRPILDNAGISITTSIDYVARLYNSLNGDQYIREGSLTIANPNKYGKQLVKIQLAEAPQSQKIYNKIVQMSYDATKLFIDQGNQGVVQASSSGASSVSNVTTVTVNKYVPLFYELDTVVVAEKSQLITQTDSTQIVAFGQGKLPIILDPFDNVFKFKIYTMTGTTTVALDLNTNSTYLMVFNPSQNPVSFGNVNDPTKENLGVGEITFVIPGDSAINILKSTDTSFYLTVTAADGTQTSMYQGTWYQVSQRDTVTALYAAEFTTAQTNSQITQNIQAIDDKVTAAASTPVSQTGNSANPAAGSTVSIPGYVAAGASSSTTSVVQQIQPVSTTQNSQ